MKIRSYRDKDYPQVKKLWLHEAMYEEPIDSRAVLRQKINYDHESILVAVDGAKVVAVTICIFDPWHSTIWHLVVRPDYRRTGVASRLEKSAMDIAVGRGHKTMGAFIVDTNAVSKEFFRRRGYGCYAKNDRNCLMLSMHKVIREK